MSIGDFRRCTKCDDWGWFGSAFLNHRCKPAWECRGEWEGDDDWRPVHASDAEEAAEKFADRYDCDGGEYAIVSSRHHDWVVLVRKPKDPDSEESPQFERWAIEAETVPQYRASKIEAPAALGKATAGGDQ